jgi:hypothetical protein
MHASVKIFSAGKPPSHAIRWRLSAVVGTMAVIGVGTVMVASPAHADTYQQKCSTYHSWTECISFDYTNGNLAVNALNGYSTSENEALWMNPFMNVRSEAFNIAPHNWAGFAVHMGNPPGDVCAGIDSVQIVCTFFG